MLRNQLLMELNQIRPGALAAHVREVDLAQGDTVLADGEIPPIVIFPEGGLLSSMAVMGDGRSVEVAALGHEGAAGLLSCLAQAPEVCRTVVRIGGPARVIAASALNAAADADEGVRRLLLQSIRTSAARAERELACDALHDVTARLAKWLLLARERTGKDHLPLTQDDMAVVLGVQRTTLNASAIHLKTAGSIGYSRGVVHILNAAQLKVAACECYRHAVVEPRSAPVSQKVA